MKELHTDYIEGWKNGMLIVVFNAWDGLVQLCVDKGVMCFIAE